MCWRSQRRRRQLVEKRKNYNDTKWARVSVVVVGRKSEKCETSRSTSVVSQLLLLLLQLKEATQRADHHTYRCLPRIHSRHENRPPLEMLPPGAHNFPTKRKKWISTDDTVFQRCRGGAPIGAGGHDAHFSRQRGTEGHNSGIIHISHIALITPLH